MKIIIRTVTGREEGCKYLTDRIPEAIVLKDAGNSMQAFLTALVMADNKSVLMIEDDIWICNNFVQKINDEVAKNPHSVIQFFSMRKADLAIGSRFDRKYSMSQCTYYPDNYPEEIYNYGKRWYRAEEHPGGYDYLVDDFLRTRKEAHYIVVPNLVDHRIGKSSVDLRRSSMRISKTFNHNDRWD